MLVFLLGFGVLGWVVLVLVYSEAWHGEHRPEPAHMLHLCRSSPASIVYLFFYVYVKLAATILWSLWDLVFLKLLLFWTGITQFDSIFLYINPFPNAYAKSIIANI